MSAADVLATGLPSATAAVACAHCGLPVPDGLIDDAPAQFCCAGCRTAFAILHEHGLTGYYTFDDRRAEPVRASGRAYEEFDHEAFHALHVALLPNGLAQVELYLEGVHCASCVWLVERVPLLLDGVSRAELEIGRSLARVVWDPRALRLSRIARMLDALGYPPHPFRGVARDELRRREDRAMLVRIGVAGAIAVNVMLAALALYSGSRGGMEHEYTAFFRWISFLLVTPALLWPGRIFFTGAAGALRARTLHMDVPIALGLAAGYTQGAVNTIRDSGPVYFDGLATLVFALVVGRYIQQRGQRAAADGAELLFSLTPSSARLVDGRDRIIEVPAQALVPGNEIETRAGDTFAADGVVVAGASEIDASLLTGESHPVGVRTGDRVFAGTVNLSSAVRVRVEQCGEASRVAKVMRQVEESSLRRAPVVQLANRVAGWFVAAVIVLAIGTFAGWWFVDRTRAVDAAIAVLIVTCPCALALSTPLAVSMAIGRAARVGIFIKGADALERLAKPGQIFLDKTGTITQARASVVEWQGDDRVKPLVLALEAASTHPIAAAFRRAWPEVVAPPANGRHVAGGGVVGSVEGHAVIIGSPSFVSRELGAREVLATGLTAGELTPVCVAVDGAVVATAGIGDPVRPDSARAIAALRGAGWAVRILSGDAVPVVEAVGARVGVSSADCVGGASPEDKVDVVAAAHALGTTAMVGDGVNDAAAMAAADVGIGVHGGVEACLASSDIYMTTPGLGALVTLVRGARRTLRVIEWNVAFSLIYNLAGAGLAVTGHLTPLVAAVLMPASSLTVVLASWRARTFES